MTRTRLWRIPRWMRSLSCETVSKRMWNRDHGNAVVEFLIVPLVLLPLVLVLGRATAIERANVQLASTARDLQRCVALSDSLTKMQLRDIAEVLLADNEIVRAREVLVTNAPGGTRVTMQIEVPELLPQQTTSLHTSVVLP